MKMQSAEFTKGLPLLEFNLTEKKIFGHTGCNNITGTIEIEGKKIRFGRLATTRMACKNMDFESAYLKELDNKIVPYQIRPGKLYLQVGVDSIFVYRKID
jgi:heat shock protein HslJ